MKVLIKKFSLQRNGVEYGAGQVVDLPTAEAVELVQGAPKEFAILEEAAQVIAAPPAEAVEEGETADLLSMTVDQLKAYAADNGIALGKTTKKAEIIALIEAAEAGGEEGLPAVDAGALVK